MKLRSVNALLKVTAMFSNQSAGFPQPLHYSSAFHFGNTIEVPNTMTATNNDNPYPHVAWLPMHAAQTITHNAHLPFPYSNHLPLRFAPPNNGSIRMHDDSNDSRIGSFLQCPAPPNHITTPLSMSFKPTQCASVSLSTSNNKALNCKTVAQLNQPRLHHKNFHLIGDKVEVFNAKPSVLLGFFRISFAWVAVEHILCRCTHKTVFYFADSNFF